MLILGVALFGILILCFPVSVAALFRVILKNADARLVALLVAALLVCCLEYVSSGYDKSITRNPIWISDIPLVNGVEIAAVLATRIAITYFISFKGIELVETIRRQAGSSEVERERHWYKEPEFRNAVAVVLLTLSFVYGVNMLVLHAILFTRLHELVLMFPVEGRRLLLLVPEVILFCIIGSVISPVFKTSKRFHWIIALAVAGSIMRWVLNRYDFPESYTVLKRLGVVIPPLLTPWFALVGYAVHSIIPSPVSKK